MQQGIQVPKYINVGSGIPTSVLEVANTLIKCLSDDRIVIENHQSRPGDPDAIWAARSSRADKIGWRTSYSLEDSLRASLHFINTM
jgi:UDP-glucose 4-epimerase